MVSSVVVSAACRHFGGSACHGQSPRMRSRAPDAAQHVALAMCCAADPGPREQRGVNVGHGYAAQRYALHRVQDTRVQQKSPLAGAFSFRVTFRDQWASAQTFFLVKYIRKAKMIRNTKTCKPSCLRASIFGSAAHIKKVVTSCAYCGSVAGEPSSKVTWPSESGFGILMAWPGKYLL